MATSAQTRSSKNDISRNLNVFNAIYKALQTSYVDSIDANTTMRDAIDAMLGEIDPYTEYYPEDEQEDFMSISTGEYGGIGSFIQQRPGKPVIVSQPRQGSPAANAGLRPGDVFIAVDGDTVTSWTSAKVSERLKGPAGTQVKVTVKRPFVEDSILTFDITREKIEIDPIPYYGVLPDGKTGYINLSTFNEKSAGAVKDAFLEMKEQGIDALVLDLRGNGGGILDGAVQILSHFLPKGTEVLRTRGRGLLNEKVYKTTGKPLDTEIPLAVLIDGNSASSSEIVTGAIQDLDRGIVVGSRSFGKGLVQSTRPLPFDGLLKVTVAKYYTPSGRLIQALDYSHRNPDGSVARTPDSLTNVYHTVMGREVRDGGGLTPDISIDWGRVSPLLYNLVGDNKIFDFATKYANTHDTIPQAWDFEITDEIYEEFKGSFDTASLQYDKVLDQLLKQLREAAEAEGYLTEEAQAAIDNLSPLLANDVNQDLDNKREEISEYLGGEIASRYYYDNGRLIQSLKNDKALKTAVETLSDKAKLNDILGKNPKKK